MIASYLVTEVFCRYTLSRASMRIRKWAIAVGVLLCLSSTFTPARRVVATRTLLTVEKDIAASATKPESGSRSDLSVENTLRFQTHWPRVTFFFLGLGAIALGLQQYRSRCRWRRVDYARKVVMEFKQQPSVQNVMSILDFEEYRTQYYSDPLTGHVQSFEATDARLRRSLREHGAMVKIKAALLTGKHNHGLYYNELMGEQKLINVDVCKQYEEIEFPTEVTLRNWFDEFLTGLENIEAMIQGGLFTARDVKPFILYWIQLMADRTVRRKGGASFYDPLFYYIHHSGYTGVETLFERFGYKVLPPPYTKRDFEQDPEFEQISFDKSDIYRALCCAKASMLVYADNSYMSDIVELWLRADDDYNYHQQSNEQFLAGVIQDWQNEQNIEQIDLRQYFKSFEHRETDTQAFLFRKREHIILVFRGTEKFQDWQTNLSLSLSKFLSAPPNKSSTKEISLGKAHRGFLKALKSIEADVVETLDLWGARSIPSTEIDSDDQVEPPKLWITGHSLGGALAALAAVSLKCQDFNVAGLYTFGQPRVGDWAFIRSAMNRLNQPKPIPVKRYANNNDIVPLIPPGFVPWQPTRLYGHFGHFQYFDSGGNLQKNTFLGQRIPDRLWGFLSALLTTGPDAVSDHFMEFYIANLQKALALEKEELELKKEE